MKKRLPGPIPVADGGEIVTVESPSDLGEEWCSSIPQKRHHFSKMKERKLPKGKT